jgi:hypothetical protein
LFPWWLIDRFAVSRFLGSHVGREHINLLVLDLSLVVDRSISRSLTFLGCHVGREQFNCWFWTFPWWLINRLVASRLLGCHVGRDHLSC